MSAALPTSPSGIVAAFRGELGNFVLNAAFEAPMTGVTALFGPSGSGKTTILRAMAGLQRLDGTLQIGAHVWQDATTFLPPHKRPVGYVFQEASLFPHLSVRENLRYGARRSRSAEPDRFEETVKLLGLDRLLDRAPERLSGGERQRVAVGRALLSRPRLLLMDEPLSALDRFAKDEILPYFEALHFALRIPVLYVSHDIAEIERLADRIVILSKGHVVASGPLNEALTGAGFGLARLPHSASVLTARVVGFDPADGLTELDVAGQPVFVGGGDSDIGATRRLRIEASDVSLSREPPVASTILNTLRARVLRIEDAGPADQAVFLALSDAESHVFVARITRRSVARFGFQPGEEVFAQVKSVSLASMPGL